MPNHNEDEAAEEAKRRVVHWVLSAISGVAGAVLISFLYWLTSIAMDARDHVKELHFTPMDHMKHEQTLNARFADLPPNATKELLKRIQDDLILLDQRLQRLERPKGE